VNGGVVERCYNTGTVTGEASTGGVVGRNAAVITASYNVGAVTGTVAVGGVCGENNGGFSDNYNHGNITGEDAVGGLVGDTGKGFGAGPLPITASANYGTVTARGLDGIAGGVAGINRAVITACYNTGAGAAASGFAGGVAGKNNICLIDYSSPRSSRWDGGYITAAYNTGTVTGTTVGGVIGYNQYDDIGAFSDQTVENCYWYVSSNPPADGIGQADAHDQDGCTEFTSGTWPNAAMPGWAAGTYGDYWKTLGSATNSPGPANLPKLRWER
jgi:hypothetical protein